MKKYIKAITLGIRYSRSFRIPDISGSIVDDFLYDNKSPFNKKSFFTSISENSIREKILTNDDDSHLLRLNTDDLILSFKIDKKIEDELNWLKNDVVDYFEKNIFKKYSIKNIKRIGIVFYHALNIDDGGQGLNDVIISITNKKLKKADNIKFSFSKKIPTLEGANFKNINDYQNAIFNFRQEPSKLIAELDFQRHYEPINEDLRDCGVSSHIDAAYNYLTDEYYKWLKNYEQK